MKINPQLNAYTYIAQYADAGHLHIPHFLDAASAKQLFSYIEKFKNWNLHLNDGEKHFDIHPSQLAQITKQHYNALRSSVERGAERGFNIFSTISHCTMPGMQMYAHSLCKRHLSF